MVPRGLRLYGGAFDHGFQNDSTHFLGIFYSINTRYCFLLRYKHALEGFSFEASNNIVNPPFANGVIYSATLSLFLPFVWYARTWYTPKSFEWYICWIGFGLIMLGIVLSYKRAAWAAAFILPFVVIAIERKWYERIIYAGLVVAVLALGYLVKDNNFYQFAPNYKQTIWHKDDLQGHLSANVSRNRDFQYGAFFTVGLQQRI